MHGQVFSHNLSVVLPQTEADVLRRTLEEGTGMLQYAKVYMKLSDLITGGFFTQYIKLGDCVMMSEGRPGIDHVFSLCKGVLRLEVDKPTYERVGIGGVSMPNHGRKHVKARYAIEINLRLPSMVRGKKGFERIVWAFKNVLNQTMTWLFYDLNGITDGEGALSIHQPKVVTVQPTIENTAGIAVPGFSQDFESHDYGIATELLEWLSLTMNGSPRVKVHDGADSLLSRYGRPLDADASPDTTESRSQDLCTFRWHGFMPLYLSKASFWEHYKRPERIGLR